MLVMMTIMLGFSSFNDPLPSIISLEAPSTFSSPLPAPLLVTSCTVIDSEDFESGTGNWIDGGGNASYLQDGVFADSGTDYLAFSGRSGSSNWATTNQNLAAYSSVTIDFSFTSTTNQETSDRFEVQYDLGAGWVIARTFEPNTHYTQGARTYASVTITDNFTASTRFRFNGEFTATNEFIYVDDVTISGCTDDCTTVISDGFESGFGNWTSGGTDATRTTNFPYTGSRVAELDDNRGVRSSIYTDLNLSSYDYVHISYFYYSTGFESNEDFWLRMSTNGGTDWTMIQDHNNEVDFYDNLRYANTVRVDGPFTASTRFEFRNDASDGGDEVHLDDILITGCNNCTEPDSDGDGLLDCSDLDDDNDGILDVDECQATDSGISGPINLGTSDFYMTQTGTMVFIDSINIGTTDYTYFATPDAYTSYFSSPI